MCPNLEIKTPERSFFGDFAEAATQRCSVNKVFLKISQNSQENMCQTLFLNEVSGLRPAQVFSCEFREIIKNSYFADHLPTAAYDCLEV